MNCNYKVKITDIQTKYKFKVFCTGYDDSEIKEKIDAMYQAWPKATAEGETPTLDNTANATMSIDLKGNTSQFTTTGKNKLPNELVSGSSNGVTYTKNSDGSITLSGTATARVEPRLYTGSYVLPAGTYINTTDTTLYYYSNGYFSVVPNGTITLSEDKTISYFYIRVENGETINQTIYPQIILSSVSDTSYEPYTNGASPNPDYPQDIHVVSGDNSINVCGKNLFTLKNITNATVLGVERTINNSELKLNGTSSGAGNIISRQTTKITLLAGTYNILVQRKSGTVTPNGKQTAFYFRKPNGTEITAFNVNSYSTDDYSFKTAFVLSEATELYVELYCNGAGYTLDNLELQFYIESGYNSTPTYEPYIGNTYPINLPNGMELCKIGDYQDYFYKDNGKWYKYNAIGKKVLDGSEVWAVHGSIASWFYYDGITNGYVLDNTQVLIKTNYYTPKAYQGVPNLVNGECSYGSSDGGITHRFVIKNTDYTQANDFKTWLSTHNTIVYYVLATPTTTEITDTTLISQLNTLAGAESYSGQTNISQTNDDKPFILTAKALKDLSNL